MGQHSEITRQVCYRSEAEVPRGLLEAARAHVPGIGGTVVLRRSAAVAATPVLKKQRVGDAGVAAEMSQADREQLLADAMAGKLVKLELVVDAYVQSEKANRNAVRFADKKLAKIALSFVGAPVLRDHAHGSMAARAGTIVASELVQTGKDSRFRQTLQLTAPWAVEMALRGNFDRFSIGWDPTGPIECSICGEAMTDCYFFMLAGCDHQPGQEYDGATAQMVYTSADGVETSAVVVPAVPEVGVVEIRGPAAAASAHTLSVQESTMKPGTLARLAAILALPVSAAAPDDDDILSGVEVLRDRADLNQTLLEAERSAHKASQIRLTEIEAEAAKVAAGARSAAADQLVARARREGKLTAGSTALEALIKREAEKDMTSAEAIVAQLPVQVPVAAPVATPGALQSARPAPTADQAGAPILTEKQLAVAKQLGVTPKQYADQLISMQADGRI